MSDQAMFYSMFSLIAFAGAAATLPLWRAGCRGSGLVDEPGHRKIHGEPTPLAGGLAVLSGFLAVLAVVFLNPKAGHPPPEVVLRFQGLLFGAIAMTLLGMTDDKWELGAGGKLFGQLLIAIGAALAGLRFGWLPPGWDHVLAVGWILAVTNAVNFMDNMNGLCAGLAVIAAGFAGLLVADAPDPFAAVLCFATAGAALGFLPYNFPRASAFLGDSGSHLLGFLLAVLPLHAQFGALPMTECLAPLVVLAVPLLDLVCVVVLRWRLGRPFYVGDTNHLSHRLERRGFSRRTAVLLIWAASAVAGGLALLL